jgi:hypothetical protein
MTLRSAALRLVALSAVVALGVLVGEGVSAVVFILVGATVVAGLPSGGYLGLGLACLVVSVLFARPSGSTAADSLAMAGAVFLATAVVRRRGTDPGTAGAGEP